MHATWLTSRLLPVVRRLMTKGEQLVTRTETKHCAFEVSRDFLQALFISFSTCKR